MAKRKHGLDTVIFNENVTGAELVKSVKKDFYGKIIINGSLHTNDELDIMQSRQWFKNGVEIKVLGDLVSEGDIYLRCMEVHGDLKCEGCIDVDYMEVWGDITCEGYINALNTRRAYTITK